MGWSEGLKKSTKKALEDCAIMPFEGKCFMKKWAENDTISGYILLDDILNYKWIIREGDSFSGDFILDEYSSIDELIEDGWAID